MSESLHSDKPGDEAARMRSEGYLDSESRIEESSARENLILWIGILGPAIIWLIQFQANYTLVSWVCATHHLWLLHTIAIVFLALCALAGLSAWMHWPGARSEHESAGAGRRRFMAAVGVMSGALFFLLISAQEIANFVIHPCVE